MPADTPDENLPPRQLLTEEHCRKAAKMAYNCAISNGMGQEDAKDCKIAFLLHLMLYLQAHATQFKPEDMTDEWLLTCANNFAHNLSRNERRRTRLIVSCDQCESSEFAEDVVPSSLPSPEGVVLNSELLHRILDVVATLNSSQRDLFQRHFLNEETVNELAHSSGKTPNTIHQAIWSLRQRLKTLLTRSNLNEQEARDYLQAANSAQK